MASHGDPVCIESYLKSDPIVALIFLKNNVLVIDFIIYGAKKARDPARVVDGVELFRREYYFVKIICGNY